MPLNLTISARDGFELRATEFGDRGKHNSYAIINSATAVSRRFYRHLAAFLAESGLTALTYDYRGIGDSRPESLRGFDARMRDWGLLDMAGVIDWVCRERSPTKLYMVSHSVGGQIAGLLDNSDAIDAMLTVSSQSGHWRLQGGEQVAWVGFHAYVSLPALSIAFGYMPWSKLAKGEDLPRNVALEWARWCRNRNYLLDDHSLPLERFRNFRAPVLAYSIGDDKWGTARAVDAMMNAYPVLERRHIEPADLGLPRLGHFGYFRPHSKALWRELRDWLGKH